MDYINKYLKYKKKYLNQKAMYGGVPVKEMINKINTSENQKITTTSLEETCKNYRQDFIKSCEENFDKSKEDIFNILSNQILAKNFKNIATNEIEFLWKYKKLTPVKYMQTLEAIKNLHINMLNFIKSVKEQRTIIPFNGEKKTIENNKDWVDAMMTLSGFSNEFNKIVESIKKSVEKPNNQIQFKQTSEIFTNQEIKSMNEYCAKDVNCQLPCQKIKSISTLGKEICKFQ
jgi:hypothetical protein